MKEIIDFFSSIKTAVVLFILIIIASIVATLFPQATADKYIYKSFWFVSILLLLIIGLISSVIKKWPFTKNKLPSILTHSSMIFILIGVLLGLTMGQKGNMYLSEGEEKGMLEREGGSSASRGIPLPFSIYLEDFKLELDEPEVKNMIKVISVHNKTVYKGDIKGPGVINVDKYDLKIEVLDLVPDFVIGEGGKVINRSENWINPAVKLRVGKDEGWIFAKFPNFHGVKLWQGYKIEFINAVSGARIKNYKSTLVIKENGKEVRKETIEVNHPLKYKGYTIYQYSYDEQNLAWTGLMIKKDPGVLVVYIGFLMLLSGLFAVLIKYSAKEKK